MTLDGGLPDGAPTDGGYLTSSECEVLCDEPATSCFVKDVGPPVVLQCQELCLGRRPAGYRGEGACSNNPVGAYFARVAQLEAASVPAFRRMARELTRFGAPRKLVRAAERAAREETRHARGAAALARKFGATPAAFKADVHGDRPLEDFAIENAVEGCVRETYGALVATWQAREARDPQVRAHMARIAKEETTHAALAWRTDAWARAKLGRAARARVDAARAKAARELANEAAAPETPSEVAALAGLPAPATAQRLASELSMRLA